jgi:hypothetical protein
MRKVIVLGIVALAAAALAVAPTAIADDGDGVIKRGKCTGSATWKLKAKMDDGRIETEFKVDQNRVGRRWRVVLRRDGAVVFRGIRRTTAPSGSFEVERLIRNSAGRDRIVATARALAGGQFCRGTVTI